MKKLLAILSIAALSSATYAQTVGSANIMGYTKVDTQGDSKYTLIGVNFTSENQTLSEIVNYTPTGSMNASTADSISLWNPGSQTFENYAFYYIDGNYPGNEGWKLLADFSYSGALQDPVVPSGSGIWLLSPAGSSTTNALISGNVASAGNVTNSIVAGLNILSNPYAVPVAVDDLGFTPTGSMVASNADTISLWNPANQIFEIYVYYYIDGNYPLNEGWKLLSDFSYSGTLQNPMVEVGQAFWYRAQSNLTWTATKPY